MDPKKIVVSFRATELLGRATELFEEAKKEFGTTDNFSKGAWLLPDGFLLNFGEERGRKDHSEIIRVFQKVFPSLKQDPDKYIEEKQFVRNLFLELGAIRLAGESGGLEIGSEPTQKQLSMITKFLAWVHLPDFFIDLSGHGSGFKHMYENTPENRAQVLNVIDDYYSGHLRQSPSLVQQYHYADETRRKLIPNR